MNKNIKTADGYTGLPNEIYTMKPAKKSNFDFPIALDIYKEPQNVIEEIRGIFGNLFRNAKIIIGKI